MPLYLVCFNECMGFREHPLRHEWGEFKRLRNGIETARTNRTSINGQLVPCVRVYLKEDASEDAVLEMERLADELGLLLWSEETQGDEEYIFVLEEHIEEYA